MFRTSSAHHQERFVQAVFADFGMWYYCAYYSTRPAVAYIYYKMIHGPYNVKLDITNLTAKTIYKMTTEEQRNLIKFVIVGAEDILRLLAYDELQK